jgi:hypothetical protein
MRLSLRDPVSAIAAALVEFGEGEEMISLRPAVLAVLVAAAFAACLAYFVTPSPRVDADPLLPATVPDMKSLPDAGTPTSSDQRRSAAAFERAAEAILKRASYAEASANTGQPPTTRHIPLPKRRPIPR